MIGAARRLLLVHAHPDDETIGTGATMAYYAAAGVQVCLVTCTLGEQGEILVPGLAQLAADQADQLGGWRIQELTAAMAELGVTDHRFLGGAGRFRDSGMVGDPANNHPRAFWRADTEAAVFAAAVTALVEIIREQRPQVIVSYDERGGYGHPDHIMAHRICAAAVPAAADPSSPAAGQPWAISKQYWTANPRSVVEDGQQALAAAETPFRQAEPDELAVLPDELVTTVIDAAGFGAAKARALAAHATQVTVHGRFYALSNGIGQPVSDTEHFRLVAGPAGGPRDADGRETDLFGGLELAADPPSGIGVQPATSAESGTGVRPTAARSGTG